MTATLVAVLAFGGLIANRTTHDSVPVAGAGLPPSPAQVAPIRQPQANTPPIDPLGRFASDDKGFVDSSARCEGPRPAFAIGRTVASLVVICAEQTGRYEYLGVRLRDAAMLRTDAETDSARGFLARKAGVVYAVSPTELKVTTGNTVVKREPMIEYRELPR